MKLVRDAVLDHLNTLGLPSVAEFFVQPVDVDQLRDALALARANGWNVSILGGGSNVILAPHIQGLVILPDMKKHWIEPCDEQYKPDSALQALLHVEAGVDWPQLVDQVAADGWWGIENLAMIPGHAGAAPVQNIGAYGVEVADLIEEVHCIDIMTNEYRVFNARECSFGYRDSVFKGMLSGHVVIVRIVLRITRKAHPILGYADLAQRTGDNPTPHEVASAVSEIRRAKLPDPRVLSNAGSFFKNPVIADHEAELLIRTHPDIPHYPAPHGVKFAAGWLIDRCGLKGKRIGHFGIHQHQALVVVHFGGGSAEELMVFANYIAEHVEARFGITLEIEPRVVGTPSF